jgi:hypothetical protein
MARRPLFIALDSPDSVWGLSLVSIKLVDGAGDILDRLSPSPPCSPASAAACLGLWLELSLEWWLAALAIQE